MFNLTQNLERPQTDLVSTYRRMMLIQLRYVTVIYSDPD